MTGVVGGEGVISPDSGTAGGYRGSIGSFSCQSPSLSLLCVLNELLSGSNLRESSINGSGSEFLQIKRSLAAFPQMKLEKYTQQR